MYRVQYIHKKNCFVTVLTTSKWYIFFFPFFLFLYLPLQPLRLIHIIFMVLLIVFSSFPQFIQFQWVLSMCKSKHRWCYTSKCCTGSALPSPKCVYVYMSPIEKKGRKEEEKNLICWPLSCYFCVFFFFEKKNPSFSLSHVDQITHTYIQGVNMNYHGNCF